MSKYDDMRAATKNGIRTAFWRLYKEKEISRITVNGIISLCGVNRSTFYRYYKDVYQILEEIEQELLEKLDRLSTQNAASYDDMDVFLEKAYEIYQEDREYLHYLVRERRDSFFAGKYSKTIQNKLPVIFMRDGSRVKDKDLEATMEIINFGVVYIFIHWADDDCLSYEKLKELFHGVSSVGIVPTLMHIYNIRPIFAIEQPK